MGGRAVHAHRFGLILYLLDPEHSGLEAVQLAPDAVLLRVLSPRPEVHCREPVSEFWHERLQGNRGVKCSRVDLWELGLKNCDRCDMRM